MDRRMMLRGGPRAPIPRPIAPATIISLACVVVAAVFFVLACWRFVELPGLKKWELSYATMFDLGETEDEQAAYGSFMALRVAIPLHVAISVAVVCGVKLVKHLERTNHSKTLTFVKFAAAWACNLVAVYGALHFIGTKSVEYWGSLGGLILFLVASCQTAEDLCVLDVVTVWGLACHVSIPDHEFYWSALVLLINSGRVLVSAVFLFFGHTGRD